MFLIYRSPRTSARLEVCGLTKFLNHVPQSSLQAATGQGYIAAEVLARPLRAKANLALGTSER